MCKKTVTSQQRAQNDEMEAWVSWQQVYCIYLHLCNYICSIFKKAHSNRMDVANTYLFGLNVKNVIIFFVYIALEKFSATSINTCATLKKQNL